MIDPVRYRPIFFLPRQRLTGPQFKRTVMISPSPTGYENGFHPGVLLSCGLSGSPAGYAAVPSSAAYI
jgi:hypothetical protein